MNRRNVLTALGSGAITGLGTLPSLSKQATNTNTFTVNIFLSNTLDKKDPQLSQKLTTEFQQYLQSTYGSVLDLTVQTDVKQTVDFPSKDTGYRTIDDLSHRGSGLYNWYQKHQQMNIDSADVNVLVAYTKPRRLQGISPTGLTPSCISSIDNYSLVWAMEPALESQEYQKEFYDDLFHMISHEIGHSIGLDHSHGITFNGKRSIMNHPSYSQKFKRNTFGQEVQFTDTRGHKLNPKISQDIVIIS
jgi:hypothetical protein